MAMPLTYAVPGAEVEKVLDYVSHEVVNNGNGQFNSYKWKPSNPKRRGFIVKTDYPGDETFSSDSVTCVWVKFEKGKPPEKCLPTQLNLVRVANERAMMALKNEAAIQKANDGLLDDMEKPVVIDQTGQPRKPGGMSKGEAEEFAKE
jgi:hypothetical protein